MLTADQARDRATRLADEISRDVSAHLAAGRRVVASSSFQTHSIPLLHILSQHPGVEVVFLDTGFHFPETLTFRDTVSARFGLDVTTVRSSVPKLAQRSADGNFLFTSNPDACCQLNKTDVIEPLLAAADVWVSGVRRDQNANRAMFEREMPGANGTIRYHPMLDWTSRLIHHYARLHDLPEHPLGAEGYSSIGCVPCTRPADLGDDRGGRWAGSTKTECGLHLDLVER